MIFYFSATGNSLWVARQFGQHFGMTPVPVADIMKKDDCCIEAGASPFVMFVFPVHSWGPAVTMLKFIERMSLRGAAGKPIYAVCTCGDDCGRTDELIEKALADRGLRLTRCFSVTMPNCYILLPLFDIDSEEVERRKLESAPARIEEIAAAIEKDEPASGLYKRGSGSWFKTRVINYGFRRYMQGETAFRTTGDCNGCGLCAEVCPEGNISLGEDRLPHWDKHCVQCLACIHRCPRRAIEYGTITVKKGRYRNPNVY